MVATSSSTVWVTMISLIRPLCESNSISSNHFRELHRNLEGSVGAKIERERIRTHLVSDWPNRSYSLHRITQRIDHFQPLLEVSGREHIVPSRNVGSTQMSRNVFGAIS